MIRPRPHPWRRVAALLLVILALYGFGAYLLVPDLWWRHEHHPGLSGRPMVTRTTAGIPGDPINVGLVGTAAEIAAAMHAAGWRPADPVTLRSSLAIGLSVVLDRPYPDAPVSPLLFEGRTQDLAFERPVGGSADRRHHVRFWMALDAGARPLFLGAASFDRGVGFSHLTGQITHHIAPDVDSERALVIDSLDAAGMLERRYFIAGSGPTLNGRNGGGDRYVTDGEVLIGVLVNDGRPPAARREPARTVTDPWWVALRRWIWALVGSAARRMA